MTCSWCKAPRSPEMTFCRSCTPHERAILAILERSD